ADDRGAGSTRPLATALEGAEDARRRRLRGRHLRHRLHPRRSRVRPLAQGVRVEGTKGSLEAPSCRCRLFGEAASASAVAPTPADRSAWLLSYARSVALRAAWCSASRRACVRGGV